MVCQLRCRIRFRGAPAVITPREHGVTVSEFRMAVLLAEPGTGYQLNSGGTAAPSEYPTAGHGEA
ncbi:hypothetical protein MF271_24035 (plasmid) [Deinococcus sp. KNUC1210]|uniref:hypothetical protein n=1 Tax=Deinococcus sp. KNUC1210 TaxID=2917691 RepID=UPI001EF15159|nr:hypothetical protein [Deinococcus sp. KNUC1210]ULH18033.1 hypothetical protein MF271_24035 [Deinococcus sp. KNUC1210]